LEYPSQSCKCLLDRDRSAAFIEKPGSSSGRAHVLPSTAHRGLSCRAELSREIPQLPSRRSGFSSATNRACDKSSSKGAEKTPSPTSSKARQLAKSLFGNNFKGALKKCLLRNARPVLSQPYPFRTMRRRPRESMDFPTRGNGSS